MIGVTQESENVCDGDDGVVPGSVQVASVEDSMLSNITVEEQPCPSTPCDVLTPAECGMPKTPPCRTLIMPDNETLEEGYDSDGNIGPFMSTNTEYEKFVSMDEVAPEAPTKVTPPPAPTMEPTAAPSLNDETIEKMKVAELRIALQARGLSKNGLKAVLIARLKTAVAAKVPLVAD